MNYSIFETEIKVRPDDIDMNNHVHSAKYFDYILAARFEQMIHNYKMSMDEFHSRGFNWVVSTSLINYKRAIKLNDRIVVRTQIGDMGGAQSKVNFWIVFKESGKTAADGYVLYTMISTASGRPVRIPEDIMERYSV